MQREGGRESSDRGRVLDYREVAPPGQDSCQPGPDMTSAEGEAGRHSQWLGGVSGAGIRGQFRGEPPAEPSMPGSGCFPLSLPGSCSLSSWGRTTT